MHQTLSWTASGLFVLVVSLNAAANSSAEERLQQRLTPMALSPATPRHPDTPLSQLLIASTHPQQGAETQGWSNHYARSKGLYDSTEATIQHPRNRVRNSGRPPEPAHHFVGGSSLSGPNRKIYASDQTYTAPSEASGAVSRVYRSSSGERKHTGHSSQSPDLGVSIYYHHDYPGYRNHSYRERQQGNDLRHYRRQYPRPGHVSKHRPRGYDQPHGYPGSLRYRGESGHSGVAGAVHIR